MYKTKTRQTVEELDNKLVENMFLACATDDEIATFYRLMELPIRGHGLATSYASKRVAKQFMHLMHRSTGLDYSSILVG